MICEAGDTVVVPFPFTDLPVTKRRPALVLSSQSFNAGHGHSVLAMITTAAGSNWPSDVDIADLDAAGIQHASYVRFKLFTLPNNLIIRRLGALSPSDRSKASHIAKDVMAL